VSIETSCCLIWAAVVICSTITRSSHKVWFYHRRRDRCRGHPQKSGKYFSGNYYVNFGHFSGKNHVKFGNFVNFSGNNHVKLGHFVNFSYIFFGQKCLAPKVDWAPTPVDFMQNENAWQSPAWCPPGGWVEKVQQKTSNGFRSDGPCTISTTANSERNRQAGFV